MEVLVIGAAVLAVLLGAGWWVAKARQEPGAVLGIALDVLTGAFLMQPTTARTRPRRGHPHRAAGKSREIATPAPADVHARTPVPVEASAVQSRPEQATARR